MDLDQDSFDPFKLYTHSNVVRKLLLPECGLTSRGTFGIEESYIFVVNEEACSAFPYLMSHGGND
ncbi:UNVERIFIED_CONTAM: hypothetical protein Sradi_5836900 [Sesamum radiatum]|uniref:Uncharacterized protein n=1 Tax=Sesamum radiatum TaxID=300843 RepID=A0AAW2KRY9_SESRA